MTENPAGSTATTEKATTDIRVGTPLPSSVMLTLGALLDAAYPGAQLVTGTDPFREEVIFRIDRNVKVNLTDEAAAALVVEPAEDGDLDIHGMSAAGVSIGTPEDVVHALLPIVKAAFEEFPDAENYLEIPVKDEDAGHRYLLTFCRSRHQTPHELRMKAEAALESAQADICREHTSVLMPLLRSRKGSAPDTYEEGVKAALEAIRELNFARVEIADTSEG